MMRGLLVCDSPFCTAALGGIATWQSKKACHLWQDQQQQYFKHEHSSWICLVCCLSGPIASTQATHVVLPQEQDMCWQHMLCGA